MGIGVLYVRVRRRPRLLLEVRPLRCLCMSTRTSVANYQMTDGEEMCYSKGRQCYLFWGLVPLGRTRVATPPDGVCEVRTRYGFWDAFVSIITGGIFEMQQIRVYTKSRQKRLHLRHLLHRQHQIAVQHLTNHKKKVNHIKKIPTDNR